MSVFLIVLLIISVLAIVIVLASVIIKYFSEMLFSKLRKLKPKIIIYRADKNKEKQSS